jgi:hypothetical protein
VCVSVSVCLFLSVSARMHIARLTRRKFFSSCMWTRHFALNLMPAR